MLFYYLCARDLSKVEAESDDPARAGVVLVDVGLAQDGADVPGHLVRVSLELDLEWDRLSYKR